MWNLGDRSRAESPDRREKTGQEGEVKEERASRERRDSRTSDTTLNPSGPTQDVSR